MPSDLVDAIKEQTKVTKEQNSKLDKLISTMEKVEENTKKDA